MTNLKRKLSFILIVMMLAMTVFPIFTANAVECQVSMTVKLGNVAMVRDATYNVNGGEKITVTASAPAGIAFIGYKFVTNGVESDIVDVYSNTLTITVPEKPVNSDVTEVRIDAVAKNDQGDPYDLTTKTGWFRYYLKYPSTGSTTEKDVFAKIDGKTLTKNSTVTASVGTKVILSATPSNSVEKIYYSWDQGTAYEILASSDDITIPTTFGTGSTHTLYVSARYADGTVLDWSKYNFNIVSSGTSTESQVTMNVKLNGITMKVGSTYKVSGGETIVATAYAPAGIYFIGYKYVVNGVETSIVDEYSDTLVLTVPAKPSNSNIREIRIDAVAKNDSGDPYDLTTKTGWQSFFLKYEDDVVDVPADDEEDFTDLPGFIENDDLDVLAVSLISRPNENEKANNNIYALKEEIIYYIDYKNGAKATDSEVKLVFNVPLGFSVVSSDGGKVSKTNKTITWTFDGMERDEVGTKEVVLKYTSLGKSSLTYKIIYPEATISLAGKQKDSSAVINMIVKEYDEEIGETHYPYMYGDANGLTFRPDDTITRAEGALVLTRIFGISTVYDSTDYNYPDLNETYEEARKAIVAATAMGLLEGYTDGTYRPNQAMTRAEFMAILAREIEYEYGSGFEIKDIDEAVRIYKDKTRGVSYGNTVVEAKWYLPYLTLLARLNMTTIGTGSNDLRANEPITRAEVAQLVNFFLLRAPAEVSRSTNSGFIDVTSRHSLFADIVEATRAAHDFSITEDGTEEEI